MSMVVNETKLNAAMTATADAIREKLGSEEAIPFDYNGGTGFADAVEAIPQGGGIDTSVTPKQVKMLVNITPDIAETHVNYFQTVANDVEVDWGDGSPVSTDSRTGDARSNCAGVSHIYTKFGLTMITLTAHAGVVGLVGSSGFIGIGGAYSNVNGNQDGQQYHRTAVVGLYLGDDYLYTNMSVNFNLMTGLQEVENLKGDTQANSVSFDQCTSLKKIKYADGITRTPLYTVCTYLKKDIVPATITSVPTNGYRNTANLRVVDFTAISLVDGILPITFGSNVFEQRSPYLQILFKDAETAAVAKTTTNLAPYAAYIHYVGE